MVTGSFCFFQRFSAGRSAVSCSDIEALQDDKSKKSEWVSRMFQDGIITGDDYLELMGEERTGLPEMQIRYTNLNRVPLGFTEPDVERSDKFYEQHGLSVAM